MGEIAYPYPNVNGTAVEVWEWISDFIPQFTVHANNRVPSYRPILSIDFRIASLVPFGSRKQRWSLILLLQANKTKQAKSSIPMFCENTLYLLKTSQFVNYQATMTCFQENQTKPSVWIFYEIYCKRFIFTENEYANYEINSTDVPSGRPFKPVPGDSGTWAFLQWGI